MEKGVQDILKNYKIKSTFVFQWTTQGWVNNDFGWTIPLVTHVLYWADRTREVRVLLLTAVVFIRSVAAVIVSVTAPAQGDALVVITAEITRRLTGQLLCKHNRQHRLTQTLRHKLKLNRAQERSLSDRKYQYIRPNDMCFNKDMMITAAESSEEEEEEEEMGQKICTWSTEERKRSCTNIWPRRHILTVRLGRSLLSVQDGTNGARRSW